MMIAGCLSDDLLIICRWPERAPEPSDLEDSRRRR